MSISDCKALLFHKYYEPWIVGYSFCDIVSEVIDLILVLTDGCIYYFFFRINISVRRNFVNGNFIEEKNWTEHMNLDTIFKELILFSRNQKSAKESRKAIDSKHKLKDWFFFLRFIYYLFMTLWLNINFMIKV